MTSDNQQMTRRFKWYYKAVKRALLKEWDPIGMSRMGGPQDEYDSYVPVICRLLMMGRPKREIFDYLWTLESQHMGMPGNRLATEHFAERLLRIPHEIEH